MKKPKHTPIDLEHYTVYPDGTVVSHKGWRGNVSKAIRPYLHNGYMVLNLTIHGQRKRWYVHKLIAELFLPKRPGPEYQLRHLNGNVKNNSVDNLSWGTAKENAEDRSRHGKTSKGPKHTKRIKEGIAVAKMNKCLISAAPEMLRALKIAQDVLAQYRLESLDQNPVGFRDLITSAIIRAEGRDE